jgi:uncharacterized protein (DUF2267 family)
VTAHINSFGHTLETTHLWLRELNDLLGWDDEHAAYAALRAVLHALRDRLSVPQVAALSAQLPMLVRGFYYEGWHPHGKPLKERKRDEFLAHVRDAFPQDPEMDHEQVVRAVFELLASRVSAGEIEKIKRTLPREIRALWSEDLPALSL